MAAGKSPPGEMVDDRNKALSKRFREQWECPCCGAIHDVDLNAAKNILNEGLRLLS